MRNTAAITFIASMLLLCPFAYAKPVDDLAACADQKEAKRRLACYDGVAKILIIEEKAREEATTKLRQEKEKEKDLQAKQGATAKLEQEREKEKQLLAKQDAAGRDAVRALKKLQARTRVGVAYRDYSSAVAEAKLDVETYVESSAAKKKPEFAARLGQALSDYETANKVWSLKFGSGSVTQWIFFKDIESALIQKYPGMDAARQNGNIRIDFALPVIWSSASNHISEAAKMIDSE